MRKSLTPMQERRQADLKRLLSLMMQRELADPRLRGITLTRLQMSVGGRDAGVWVHRHGDVDVADLLQRLHKMAGHFQAELARSLGIHKAPKLSFHWDKNIAEGDRISRLLQQLERESLS